MMNSKELHTKLSERYNNVSLEYTSTKLWLISVPIECIMDFFDILDLLRKWKVEVFMPEYSCETVHEYAKIYMEK